MEDTKKLIEKYKRELMELSRRSPRSAPPPNAAPQSDIPKNRTAETEKKPRIIGYVNEESGEFPAVYDRFLSEIIKDDESAHPKDIVENDENIQSEETVGNDGEIVRSEETVDTGDEIIQSEEPVDTGGEAVSSEEITEIDDEIVQPDDSSENNDESADGSENEDIIEPNGSLFTPPNYTNISSTEQVREDITEQSVPSENVPEENVSGVTDNSGTAPKPGFTNVQSISEEKAETLNDQPISGTSEGEQLTGRSFEDESYPQNPDNPFDSIMRQGSGAEPIKYPEPVYDSIEDFERKNTGKGSIQFKVYTAREAMPIAKAKCVISKKIGGAELELRTLFTDSSGQTPSETLPAPSRELSQSFENSIQPFSLYDASIKKDGFAEVILRDIPVFDGVQSIQNVSMIPAPSEDVTEKITEVDNAL